MVKELLYKYAATFGDTRKMLEWAKANKVSIVRTPKELGDKGARNYFSNLRQKNINSSAFDFTDPIASFEKKNFKRISNFFSKSSKYGPSYNKQQNRVYLPREKDFSYKNLKTNPTDALGHELGHAKDLKTGLLKNTSISDIFGSLSKIPRERRANTEAIKTFISPENKKDFSNAIKNGEGFKSYTKGGLDILTGRSYKDTKNLNYKDWVQRRKNISEGTGMFGKKIKNFLTSPFKPKYDPLTKGQNLIQSTIAQSKMASEKDYAPGLPRKSKITELPEKKDKIWEFVIQKHYADRAGLHYDVRLGDPETGVGHSFVTKKTPPKIGERVLARHTSDHRIPYFDFKGKIDKGYGKGLVKRYVRGKAYVHQSSPDKLSFSLDNKSKHTLVRMKDKNWLLIKSKREPQKSYMLRTSVKEAEDKQYFNREEVQDHINLVMSDLKPNAHKIDIVGSYSRGHEKIRDLDIVMFPKKSFKDINDFINPKNKKFVRFDADGLPVNLWLTDKKSYEPTKMHFSLGKHIIRLKGEAKKRGMKLTRYGLQDHNTLHTKEKKIKSILEKN